MLPASTADRERTRLLDEGREEIIATKVAGGRWGSGPRR